MDRYLAVMILGGLAIAQMPITLAQSGRVAVSQPEVRAESASVDLPNLPPVPRGKSTILGGEIRNVDPVRDVLTLGVFGKRSMKILFDERTQVYLDGKKTSLRDLGPAVHASVQTVLDGTDVYAISIHVLSRAPDGEYEGRVLSFNAGTHELTVSSALSRESTKLLVPANTPVARVGQAEFASVHSGLSDLVLGSLILVRFEPDKAGRAVASQIAILATPGSTFVFTGDLSALDVHTGLLVLIDPRDNKTYQVFFDSVSFPTSQDLHLGDHVRVNAQFDGIRYVASAISVNKL